jgi:cell division transport system ATP-binding protein
MIKMQNVTMKYPTGTVALKDVNINIEKGEFVFVVGSTGSGKTTFIELLLKELVPTKGHIEVAGYDYSKIRKNRIHKVRRKIGVVFQNFRLLKDRTVYENVAFAQRVIETPNRYIKRRVPAVHSLVGLEDKYKSYPRQLSGGEQQRVSIARALAKNPKLLLCDEPTGALDSKTSRDILVLLEKINEKYGTTMLIVTHNNSIKNMVHKVIIIKDGLVKREYENEKRVPAAELEDL